MFIKPTQATYVSKPKPDDIVFRGIDPKKKREIFCGGVATSKKDMFGNKNGK